VRFEPSLPPQPIGSAADDTENVRQQSLHGLKFATLNIRSITNKSADIYDITVDSELDVLTLTETWHTSSDDLPLRRSVPPGYSIIDAPRARCGATATLATNHGGVAILFRDRFAARRMDLGFLPSTFEVLACSLRSASTSLIHVVVYRPGSQPITAQFFSDLTTLLETVATYQSQVVLSGDFNVHVDDRSDPHAVQLLELLDMFDLRQSVQHPTHKCGHTLDLIITRQDVVPSDMRVDPPVYSDHSLVSCRFPTVCFAAAQTTAATSKLVRSWKRFDKDAFRQSILDSPLCKDVSRYADCSPVELFDLYDETLRKLLDEHLPAENVVIKERPLAPWFDSECRAARRFVRLCERRYRRTHTTTDCQAWIRALEKKKRIVQRKQEDYWHSQIASNAGRPRKLWRCMDRLLLRDQSKRTTPLTAVSADSLSTFFNVKVEAVRDSTANASPPTFSQLTDQNFPAFHECSTEEVRRTLLESPVKSCSLDPLPTFLLREFVDDLLPFIRTMCNASLRVGQLPESQKAAIITPVLKKPGLDADECKNYRPISNLTFISKVIERLVARQLTEYLQDNKLLPTFQSAYRRGHSTETALLKIISDIFDAADANPSRVTLLGMLDLSAAFDTVDHETLLARLQQSYGISGSALSWLASFLSTRSQTVAFNSQSSAATRLQHGVPQGSVLGPLLFLLYTADVADIAAKLGVQVHAYADDTQLYFDCAASSEQAAIDRLKECIRCIEAWMRSNRLKLNADKTQFMWLGTRQQLLKLHIHCIVLDGTRINITTTAKNLGVTLDSEMSMEAHVNGVTRSCFHQLRQLRSVRGSLTRDAALTLVHAFVSSRIDYCNAIYAGISRTISRKLQVILNAAARLVTDTGRFAHITPVMRDVLHWLPIRQRVDYKLASTVYRCLHNTAPIYLASACIPVASIASRRGLRSATHGDLYIRDIRTTRFGARSFSSSGPAVWNSLPPDIRNPELTFTCFRSQLKTFLFRSAYAEL